jgi:phosphoribosylformylglycinamidine synthase
MSSFYVREDSAFELYEVRLRGLDKDGLLRVSQDLGIGLSLEEMKACQDYFSRTGRDPTDVELQTVGQTWSEHCFHKSFKGDIVTDGGTINGIFDAYIARATRELRPSWCLSVFEDNAGIVSFDEGGSSIYAIAAKVETHNHPSAIEPFGGAATGVGGVIRDILGVWADPIACTDVLCFGPLNHGYEGLPRGTKHPRYLFSGVVAGIGAYGNNMGIPTINGGIFFDESYLGNVVVYCGCVGLLRFDWFVRETRPGDIALLAGGETGRDGIHGVTFASAELTDESEETSRTAVQIPNPLEEEKLKRAILEMAPRRLASSITDLGGGGLSCAAGEMAHRAGCGLDVELEKVPLKYSGLAPWEIYVSESQERMLLSVPERNLLAVMTIFEDEGVRATAIGKFNDTGALIVRYDGHQVADLDINFLFSPPRTTRYAKWIEPALEDPRLDEPDQLGGDLIGILSSPNVCSRESVIRTYDHEVKGGTALKPLQGDMSGPNDAAVLKPLPGSWKGIVISSGMNPRYGMIDPYWMAASSIDEAIRNNVAVGGRRIALLDNFVWGSPEKPDRLGGLVRAAEACYDVAKAFGTPFISGKDSLYNESPLGPVTPTLLITAIGIIPDVRNAISLDLKRPGDPLFIAGTTSSEMGGSEYLRLKGFLGRSVPKVDVSASKAISEAITRAVDAGCLRACHDVSQGGLGISAAEMVLSGRCGLELDLSKVPVANAHRDDHVLFSESNGRFLMEVDVGRLGEFKGIMRDVICAEIGHVTNERALHVRGMGGKVLLGIDARELEVAWKGGLGRST